MKNTKIISAFPGTGKTYCCNKYKGTNVKILDSDSSEFSWIKDKNGNNTKERNPKFPNNYIEHIKENIGKVDIIFVSSHDIVRKALKDNNIDYILVYPCVYYKDIYIDRYIKRGNNENFINFIDKNFKKFINEMDNEDFPYKIVLTGKETINDILQNGYCQHMACGDAYGTLGCPVMCKNCDYPVRLIKEGNHE